MSKKRLVTYMLGETPCMSLTHAVHAITSTPTGLRLIPGTKSYFSGNGALGRDLISYFSLPSFLELRSEEDDVALDQPTTLITRDPISSSTIGLQVNAVLGFVPVEEIADSSPDALSVPPRLAPYCVGVVNARGRHWALIDLDQIVIDSTFRAVELETQRQ